MQERYGVGIDIGTSKIGAVLVEARTRRVALAISRDNDALLPDLPEGRHEQSPRRIVEIAAEACRQLLTESGAKPEQLAGVGVTGQMHGVLLVDEKREPQTPLVTWRDRRAEGEFLAELRTAAGAEYARRTGCELNCGYGGVTLAWLLRRGAGSGGLALTIADYLGARLCGVAATAASHAASWGIFNLRAGAWDAELAQALGIPPGLLPPVRNESPRLGGCTRRAAAEFGLPEGTPVWLAVGDNQASVYAAADGGADCAVLNLGTGGQVSLPTDEIVCGCGCETRPGAGGGLLRVGASLCGGWSYAYLCEFFRQVCREIGGAEVAAEQVYARMGELVRDKRGGTLLVDPRFAGSRGGARAGGAICNIDTENLRPAELIYAFQEGMVRELAELGGAGGAGRARRVVATGNAVRKNPGLPELIEKIFGLPCSLSPHREEAAAGAALWMLDAAGRGER